MTQDCSISLSTADENTCFSEGKHVTDAKNQLASEVERLSISEVRTAVSEIPTSWSYIFIHHMSAETFEKRMEICRKRDEAVPRYFIHRSYVYRSKEDDKGVKKELRPSVSGLIFLQGTTKDLQQFLNRNFPLYHLVKDCSTDRPASIANATMEPFMKILQTNPEHITFLRDPFVKFAQNHTKLRVLSGLFQGQEGYIVRIDRDRQLVMEFGGYAVAIRGMRNEDFEVVGEEC